MEIERINENTVKFYISYMDIEDRGFEREEIWYNRERSEQLFWQMMEELNYKEDFTIEGPLWIQVQALEKGLEVIVTKAQMSQTGDSLELPIDDDKTLDITVEEKIENILDQKFGKQSKLIEDDDPFMFDDEEDVMWFVISFADFEDVIQLSHAFHTQHDYIKETLFHFEDSYYLYIEFLQDYLDDSEQEDKISQYLEYGHDTDISIHVLEEYGKVIFEKNALAQIREYFPL